MKSKGRLIAILIIIAVILAACGMTLGIVLHSGSPKAAVKAFHDSILPDYNAAELEKSVGSKAYSIRFDDGGYFVDRYERAREQIVYYYGEEFDSQLSELTVSDVEDYELSSIKKEYLSKYSLTVDSAKKVSFTVTLSSEFGEKSRVQSLTALKIDGKWVIYDYDAYWFAYM